MRRSTKPILEAVKTLVDLKDTKVCKDCLDRKPVNDFLPVRRGIYRYRDSRCDECRRIACICRNMVITLAEYRSIVAASGGKCLICVRAFGIDVRMVIDHRHSTGQLRSAICSGCNTALGMLRDNPEVAEAAAAYLLDWDGKHELMPIDEACERREHNMGKNTLGKRLCSSSVI